MDVNHTIVYIISSSCKLRCDVDGSHEGEPHLTFHFEHDQLVDSPDFCVVDDLILSWEYANETFVESGANHCNSVGAIGND